MIGGGLGPYAPGEYSDDTQMAVCIAEVTATDADLTQPETLDRIADAFIAWSNDGATDIGTSTGDVLGDVDAGPDSAARLAESAARVLGSTGLGAGNGGLMRTGIVGLTALGDREHTARSARAVCELTHADPLAAESCILWSEAVRVAAIEGALLGARWGASAVPDRYRSLVHGWPGHTAPDLVRLADLTARAGEPDQHGEVIVADQGTGGAGSLVTPCSTPARA